MGGGDFGGRLRAQHALLARAAGEDAWAALPREGRRAAASAAGFAADEDEDGDEDEDEDEDEEAAEQRRDAAAARAEGEAVLRRAGPLVARPASASLSAAAGGAGSGSAAAGAGSGAPLPAGALGVSRLRDANLAEPARAVVQALAFHPGGAVLLCGSLDHRVRFFAADGKRNSRLASVFFPDLPVASAVWTGGDGAEVVVTGRRPFFYAYDVAAGKAHRVPRIAGREERSLESCVASPAPPGDASSLLAFLGAGGATVLCSSRTKQLVASLRMEGSVRAAAFSRGPTGGGGGAGALAFPELLTVGGGGEVFRWCLRTMRCLARHADEGGAAASAVAASPDGRSYAVGSAMGVVNVYDAAAGAVTAAAAAAGAAADGSEPRLFGEAAAALRPSATSMHLTTTVSTLAYSPDGALLLMASHGAKDQLRLLHAASRTVVANWPTQRTPLHFVTAAAWSPGGAFLSVGNDRGRALLYRLHAYDRV